MDGSQLLFERDGVLLQGNPLLDDIGVIGFQVTVLPGKDIRKLFYRDTKFGPLISSQLSGQIYKFWMALATYVVLLESRVLVLFGKLERDIIMIKNIFQGYQTPRYIITG